MILRNFAVRHGRRAFATQYRNTFLRSLSIETETLLHETEAIAQSIENTTKETHSIEASINQLSIAERFVPPSDAGEEDHEVAANHNLLRTIRKRTHKLGSVPTPEYEPSELIHNPPRPKDITLELLMASQSHMGHSTSVWNPMNQRYIYGIRQGIHIISLEVTAAHLRRAAKVVEGVAYHGGLILFVGTRKGQSACVVKAAKLARGCHLFERWKPGTITNGNEILRKCAIRAVDRLDRDVDGFDEKIQNWTALKPDLVVVLNPLENYLLLHECGLNNIPTIGVIDTNADPTWVTYPIPANDDSLRCVQVIAGVLGRAAEAGQEKRLAAAAKGIVTWEPPKGLGLPVTEEDKVKAEKRRVAAAQREKEAAIEKDKQIKINAARRELYNR
ncbi:ribosomal protein S2, flavodoxin-like domain-containing protein [Bisporella sp. PMI_857]|nr:ribosomal protein S2, flavodoxin-like domain-containing protein [Bisporella sp. PMI_857]